MSERDTPVLVQVANAKPEAAASCHPSRLESHKLEPQKGSVQLRTDYKSLLYKIKVLSIKKENSAPDDIGSRVMVTGSRTS